MPDIDKNEKPWPYIKFMHMKKVATPKEGTVETTEAVEPCFYRATGCHGTPEKIAQLQRNKKVLVGYGNLNAPKYKALKAYLNTALGVSLDPKLQAIRESVLGERLDERRRNESNKRNS